MMSGQHVAMRASALNEMLRFDINDPEDWYFLMDDGRLVEHDGTEWWNPEKEAADDPEEWEHLKELYDYDVRSFHEQNEYQERNARFVLEGLKDRRLLEYVKAIDPFRGLELLAELIQKFETHIVDFSDTVSPGTRYAKWLNRRVARHERIHELSQWLFLLGSLGMSDSEAAALTPEGLASLSDVDESSTERSNDGLNSIDPGGRHADVLIAMDEHSITTSTSRQVQTAITKLAFGHDHTNDVRRVYHKLRHLGFIKKGDNGRGFYLTKVGQRAATKLRQERI